MNSTKSRPAIAKPDRLPLTASAMASGLNAMAVYQDDQARERIMEFRDCVSRSIGRQSLHLRLWSFRELSETENFQEAVVAAVAADVVIVSIRATEKLPARFCGWIDSCVPRRCRRDGALIALVDVTGLDSAASEHAREYLRSVACEAHLEFLLREYSVATADGSFKMGMIPAETGVAMSEH